MSTGEPPFFEVSCAKPAILLPFVASEPRTLIIPKPFAPA